MRSSVSVYGLCAGLGIFDFSFIACYAPGMLSLTVSSIHVFHTVLFLCHSGHKKLEHDLCSLISFRTYIVAHSLYSLISFRTYIKRRLANIVYSYFVQVTSPSNTVVYRHLNPVNAFGQDSFRSFRTSHCILYNLAVDIREHSTPGYYFDK